ncbi:hypothetical protein HD554DRAFT_1670758 [Boletus coccyginus]|nr:hypothetical protein HD554DRAFT_1670758 [Boletus coccyginus]
MASSSSKAYSSRAQHHYAAHIPFPHVADRSVLRTLGIIIISALGLCSARLGYTAPLISTVGECCFSLASPVRRISHLPATTFFHQDQLHLTLGSCLINLSLATSSVLSKRGPLWLDWAPRPCQSTCPTRSCHEIISSLSSSYPNTGPVFRSRSLTSLRGLRGDLLGVPGRGSWAP